MESEQEAKRRRLEARFGGGGGAGPSAPPPPQPPSREAFTAQANEALSFRLVRTAAELASAPLFHPEFTHQVFREDETIFGYRDLKARAKRKLARPARPARERHTATRARRERERLRCGCVGAVAWRRAKTLGRFALR
jgi:hypothetical protein